MCLFPLLKGKQPYYLNLTVGPPRWGGLFQFLPENSLQSLGPMYKKGSNHCFPQGGARWEDTEFARIPLCSMLDLWAKKSSESTQLQPPSDSNSVKCSKPELPAEPTHGTEWRTRYVINIVLALAHREHIIGYLDSIHLLLMVPEVSKTSHGCRSQSSTLRLTADMAFQVTWWKRSSN